MIATAAPIGSGINTISYQPMVAAWTNTIPYITRAVAVGSVG